jgi:ATP-binding cassette subfamily E protein 1
MIVFHGIPSKKGYATKPLDKRRAMNKFLKDIGITLRRDKHSGRPRINKPRSRLDREQKEIGEYYYLK